MCSSPAPCDTHWPMAPLHMEPASLGTASSPLRHCRDPPSFCQLQAGALELQPETKQNQTQQLRSFKQLLNPHLLMRGDLQTADGEYNEFRAHEEFQYPGSHQMPILHQHTSPLPHLTQQKGEGSGLSSPPASVASYPIPKTSPVHWQLLPQVHQVPGTTEAPTEPGAVAGH